MLERLDMDVLRHQLNNLELSTPSKVSPPAVGSILSTSPSRRSVTEDSGGKWAAPRSRSSGRPARSDDVRSSHALSAEEKELEQLRKLEVYIAHRVRDLQQVARDSESPARDLSPKRPQQHNAMDDMSDSTPAGSPDLLHSPAKLCVVPPLALSSIPPLIFPKVSSEQCELQDDVLGQRSRPSNHTDWSPGRPIAFRRLITSLSSDASFSESAFSSPANSARSVYSQN
jgi:hypothetical protein